MAHSGKKLLTSETEARGMFPSTKTSKVATDCWKESRKTLAGMRIFYFHLTYNIKALS